MTKSVFEAQATRKGLEHGDVIDFGSDRLPVPFRDGMEFVVVYPDNTRDLLRAEPDHGPTKVGWHYRGSQYWIFDIEHVADGKWRICNDEHHREIRDLDKKAGR